MTMVMMMIMIMIMIIIIIIIIIIFFSNINVCKRLIFTFLYFGEGFYNLGWLQSKDLTSATVGMPTTRQM